MVCHVMRVEIAIWGGEGPELGAADGIVWLAVESAKA